MPSEADLVRAHGVSRNTVRRALNALASEGLVESVPGSGWRIGRGETPLVDRMTSLIAQDSLIVGDGFPSESQLCERFGASRTAVRRALAKMEGSGLLDTVHGRGRTVHALPASAGQP
ncbi:winged helix-turn-helix transcriptional regulator [Streptomyces sp. SHP 1-2]|nr:winged helix-turn-helix transcriptional regulator [Streptomyces sp. SHP 1-2]